MKRLLWKVGNGEVEKDLKWIPQLVDKKSIWVVGHQKKELLRRMQNLTDFWKNTADGDRLLP